MHPSDISRQVASVRQRLLVRRHGLGAILFSLKFQARALWYRRTIAAMTEALDQPPFRDVLDKDFKLALRPLRPYLVAGLNLNDRMRAVLFHYETAATRLSREAFAKLYEHGFESEGLPLLKRETTAGLLKIMLRPSTEFYRESEWTIELTVDDDPLTILGISFVEPALIGGDNNGIGLWLGAMKAMEAGPRALDRARALTKSLEGLRPKSLLLLAARALAQSLDLTGLYAVTNEGRIFSIARATRHLVKADYDGFWEESGGVRLSPVVYALPIRPEPRPLETYKSKKRAEARRRQALEADVMQTLTANFHRLCASTPPAPVR